MPADAPRCATGHLCAGQDTGAMPAHRPGRAAAAAAGRAPEIAVRDARGARVVVRARHAALQPADEPLHLRQRRAGQLRAVLLRPAPDLRRAPRPRWGSARPPACEGAGSTVLVPELRGCYGRKPPGRQKVCKL